MFTGTALVMWKSYPKTLGGNPGSQAGMAQVEVWMSLAAWSVAEQRNVGSFKLYPVCCSAIARPIPAPHSVRRGESQQNHFWDQINVSLVFSVPRSLWTHFSFSTHSLTSFSITPFHCRGVVFRSPPATRGRPRWPTEGGKGELNAYC